VDGPKGYYTSPRYNINVNQGALIEVARRRTWPRVEYWDSGPLLYVGRPAMTPSSYFKRNEYFYIGRTKPGGILKITSIQVTGPQAKFFRVDRTNATLKPGQHLRLKISFRSRTPVWENGLLAYLEIRNSVNGLRRIKLFGGRNRV